MNISLRTTVLLIALALVLPALHGCGESPPGTMRIQKAHWVPSFKHEGRWIAVPVDGSISDGISSDDPDKILELPPGRYDIYWVQGYKHEKDPMLLAGKVLVESGQETTVVADSGIMLDEADWVPELEHEGWWGAVPTGRPKSERLDWTDADQYLLLPPGRYDIYRVQGYTHEKDSMRLAGDVLVEAGQVTTLDARSGIHLDEADWVPDLKHEGWWGAVPAGKPLSDRVDWTDDDESLLLPPGRYDVYWVQGYEHAKDPMRFASDVLVETGKASNVDARSGIRLDMAETVPEIGHNGWWGVVPAGRTKVERVDWSSSKDEPLLLPPGTYDVYWKQDYNSETTRIHEGVVVPPGQLLVLTGDLEPQSPG